MASAERGGHSEQSHGHLAGRFLLVAAATGGLYLGVDLAGQASADTGTSVGAVHGGDATGAHGGQEGQHSASGVSSSQEQSGATTADTVQTQHGQGSTHEGSVPSQAVPVRPESGSFGGHSPSAGSSGGGHESTAAQTTVSNGRQSEGKTTPSTTASAPSSATASSAEAPVSAVSAASGATSSAGNGHTEHTGQQGQKDKPAGNVAAPGPDHSSAPESAPSSTVPAAPVVVPQRPAPATGAAAPSEHPTVDPVSTVNNRSSDVPAGSSSANNGGSIPAHGERSSTAPKNNWVPAGPVPSRPAPRGHTDTAPSPASQPASAPAAGPEMAGNVVYYNQHDEPWAGHRYDGGSGTGDIDRNGCGATTLAEAISTLAHQTVTPNQVADDLMAHGEVTLDGSTKWSAILNEPQRYGLRTEAFTNLHIIPDLRHTIEKGGVIAINGTDIHPDPNTPATTGGHFFLIRDITADGKFYVADPNSRENSQKSFTADEILGPATFAAEILPATPPSAPAPSSSTTETSSHDQSGSTTTLSDNYTKDIPVPPRPQPAGHNRSQTPVPQRPQPAGVPAPAPAPSPGPASPTESSPAPLSDHDRIMQATQQLINQGGEWAVRGTVLRHFLLEGYSPARAAGIDGNFMGESSDNPSENQHGGGPGKGLGQWEEGGRFDTDPVNLVDFAKSKHTPWTDLETQLQFTDREFSTSEAGAAQKLQTVDTPKEAALIVSRFYERPNPASAHNDHREAYAQEDYDAYQAALASISQ